MSAQNRLRSLGLSLRFIAPLAITLGFLADAFGRKPAAMLFYLMCLVLTPVVYLWAQSIDRVGSRKISAPPPGQESNPASLNFPITSSSLSL